MNKGFGILFCLSFTSFILFSFYLILALVVIGEISLIKYSFLIILLFSSIYFISKYEFEEKGIKEIKDSKVYNISYEQEYDEEKNLYHA